MRSEADTAEAQAARLEVTYLMSSLSLFSSRSLLWYFSLLWAGGFHCAWSSWSVLVQAAVQSQGGDADPAVRAQALQAISQVMRYS